MILSCPPCAVTHVLAGVPPGHLLSPNRLTHEGHRAQLLVLLRPGHRGYRTWGYEPVRVRG